MRLVRTQLPFQEKTSRAPCCCLCLYYSSSSNTGQPHKKTLLRAGFLLFFCNYVLQTRVGNLEVEFHAHTVLVDVSSSIEVTPTTMKTQCFVHCICYT